MNQNEIDDIVNFLHCNATNRSKAADKDDIPNPTPADDNKIKLTSVGVMVNLIYGTYYVNCFYDNTTKAYRLDFEDEDKTQWDNFVLAIRESIKKKKSPFSKVSKVIDEVAAKADEPITAEDTGSNEETPDDVMCDDCKLPKDSCECEWE